jgi:hypothetical protein
LLQKEDFCFSKENFRETKLKRIEENQKKRNRSEVFKRTDASDA